MSPGSKRRRRRCARGEGRVVEWERVAEELEDMGRAEAAQVEARLVQIVAHLHKLRSSHAHDPRRHWKAETVAYRRALARRMTPTIRRKIAFALDAIHIDGADIASRRLAELEPAAAPVDAEVRWTLAQLLGEADDPVGAM
jgi:hypothetical protein